MVLAVEGHSREYEGRGTLALRPHLTILDSPDDDRLCSTK